MDSVLHGAGDATSAGGRERGGWSEAHDSAGGAVCGTDAHPRTLAVRQNPAILAGPYRLAGRGAGVHFYAYPGESSIYGICGHSCRIWRVRDWHCDWGVDTPAQAHLGAY